VTLRVLLADDHAQFRAMIADTLEEAGIFVCAQAPSGDAAVELAVQLRPDVALLDIRMPGSGIAAARRITAEAPETRVLMLTVSAESEDVLDALQAGAQGYVLKGAPPEEIVAAVHAVHAGAAVLTPAIAPTVVDEVRRSRGRHLRSASGESVQLTEREWHILEQLERGEGTGTIASNLYVAPVTVRTHIAALMKKLGVHDRAAAVSLFRRGRPPQ
jgi:DNA-binding NarL/FixJ family response regulator